MPAADFRPDLILIAEAAREAGVLAMSYFGDGARRWTKEDDSPVTEADVAVDGLLHQRLRDARPDYGWLSEERADDLSRLQRRRVFIVDPIDGTRAFIAQEQGWVISIGVVEDGVPAAGVLFDPVADELWCALRGGGATRNGRVLTVGTRERLEGAHIAATKKAIRLAGLAGYGDAIRRTFTKSLARRLGLVANGEFDAALAASAARDWDLAAGVLLVQEAGGRSSDLSGAPLRFNRAETRHLPLVAAGPPLHAAILAAAQDADEVTEASR